MYGISAAGTKINPLVVHITEQEVGRKMSSRHRNKRRLLPSLLPILPMENHVLLPGSSMVVEVNDPRGYK